MVYLNSNELTHYGILGMKWGIRRYQNPDGSLTELGKKRYGTAENLESGKTVKQIKRHESAKQKAISSGNAEKVQKFSKELTKEEMDRAFQRINDEQKLSDLRVKDIVAGKEKLAELVAVGEKVRDAGQKMTEIYNIGAKAYNAFNTSGKKLPIIGEKSESSKPSDDMIRFNLAREKERWKWEQEKHAAEAKS